MKIIYPDYNNCLINVSNSILKYFDIEPYHNTLKELDEILEKGKYKNVVLILNDGLGSKILEKHLEEDSFLRKHKIKDLTSVYPATTAAATTSVVTGLTSMEHGWLGWDVYFKEIDKTVTLYWNVLKDTNIQAEDYNVAQKFISYKDTTLVNKIKNNTKYQSYGISPFEYDNYSLDNPNEMYEQIEKLCNLDGKKFIYCYYPEPDYTMHELGTNAKEVTNLIKNINDNIEKLSNKVKDTLIISIADHGLIDVNRILLSDYPSITETLIRETSLDPRAINFFVKDNMKEQFVNEFNKYFSNDYILLSKEEVIEKQLFGFGNKSNIFDTSIGDYIGLAISNISIDYDDRHPIFKAQHAGITEDEMLVPLIIIEKE